jgi:Kef-type K+ transport system membrane component KefB/mannitol/fructose-specific phosphotransferase system IIA component (Ntr-type)
MRYKRFACLAVIFIFGVMPVLALESAGSLPDNEMPSKMLMLAIQIGIILFAARLGGMLAERIKIPSVLGELMAGIAIGPYAFGSMNLGGIFSSGLFPAPGAGVTFPVTPELYGFCTVASILLLFLSGVETDLKLFVRYSLAGSLVGIGGVVVSYLFGSLSAVFLLHRFAGGDPVSFLSAEALFMGIMSTATSVGITARILSEHKAIDSPEGVTTMAGAVIDDVLGIVVLAVGMGVLSAQKAGNATGIDWYAIGKIAFKAFGIWLGATFVGVISARKISGLLKMFGSESSIAIMSFGMALMVAGLFESVHLAMIIGAYVMGLALSRTDIRYVINENLMPIYSFMVPIFFCVMGMMVDLRALFSIPIFTFGLIFSVLAIVAKILGCSIPALFCGFNTRGALRIGAGMIPRGEVALIVAGIGLASGFLHPIVFSVGIMMTLLTTLIAPPIMVEFYKNKKSGLIHPQAEDDISRQLSLALPSDEVAIALCERLIKAFRAEGFFTHRLSHSDYIWQMRQDDVEIGMSCKDENVIFDCSRSEEPFIATAVMYVTTELTRLARELAKPVETFGITDFVRTVDTSANIEKKQVDSYIARYLRNFIMIPGLKAGNKEETLAEMMKILYVKGKIKKPDAVMKLIHEREAAMSTGLEDGIAIPHVKTDLAKTLIGIVAVLEKEITDYETVDGSNIKIVILTISPQTMQTPHLRIIAHISRALDSMGRTKLIAAETEKEMFDVFM